ncbi:hypothetical protein FQZ97_1005430 [compost metagenome]
MTTDLVVQPPHARFNVQRAAFFEQVAGGVGVHPFIGHTLGQAAVPLALRVGRLVQVVEPFLRQPATAGSLQRLTWRCSG